MSKAEVGEDFTSFCQEYAYLVKVNPQLSSNVISGPWINFVKMAEVALGISDSTLLVLVILLHQIWK